MLRPGRLLLPDGELAGGLQLTVHAGLIADVGPVGQIPTPAAQIVDLPHATLIPGLIDSHTHLTFSADDQLTDNLLREGVAEQVVRATDNAQQALAAGVTTVIDCGGITEVVLQVRNAIAAGRVVGPRLLVSGAPLTTTGGHCHWLGGECDTLDELIGAVRSHSAAGVDFIKVMVTGGNITPGSNPALLQYSPDVVAAVAAECHRLGLPLVTHAHSAEAVQLCASVGARVIAHATCARTDGVIDVDTDAVTTLVDLGCRVDPTLTVARPGYGDDSERSERRRAQRQAMLPVFHRMHESGVVLLAGTDAGVPGVPHGSVAGSVVALHREVGLSVPEALHAATSEPARAFGIVEEVGVLAAGAVADLVVLDGDVSQDVDAVSRPLAVWSAGTLVARDGRLQAFPSAPLGAGPS